MNGEMLYVNGQTFMNGQTSCMNGQMIFYERTDLDERTDVIL